MTSETDATSIGQKPEPETKPGHVWVAVTCVVFLLRLLTPNLADLYDVSVELMQAITDWALVTCWTVGLVMVWVWIIRGLLRRRTVQPTPRPDDVAEPSTGGLEPAGGGSAWPPHA